MSLTAQITLPGRPSDDELEAVRRIVQDAGVDASIARQDVTRGVSEALVAVLVTVPLAEFFKTIGSQAGQETGRAIGRFVQRLASAQKHTDPEIWVEDLDSGPIVHLRPSLPDDAYAALSSIDWSAFGDGDLTWDAESGSWQLLD
jgi:hypothetical protein